MTKIRVLDDTTINQIKAGEVVESPSSVVKELVENSLDAGSSCISVEITGGGQQLIRIVDDGCGMGVDDARLCLERHATSKIRDVNDIHSIETMGFRGEALPSIASVSKFLLLTKATGEVASMVAVEGGKVTLSCSAERDVGTTIEIKELFYNVPVRKRFQKSPAQDENEILKVMTFFALAHPGVRFELIANQKNLLQVPAQEGLSLQDGLKSRVKELLGSLEEMRWISHTKGDYCLEGLISVPTYSRPNRVGQYLFINKRAVVSPLVSQSARMGYGPALGTNRFPLFVLHLTLPGKEVDVNVHPQKKEVRLRHESFVRALVMSAIEKGLQGISLPPIFHEEPVYTPIPSIWNRSTTPFIAAEQLEMETSMPAPRVIATLPHYILLDGDSLTLVDQKAAQQRICYEKLLAALEEDTPVSSQALLIPIPLSLAAWEGKLLRLQKDVLGKMGVTIEELGPTSFAITALSSLFEADDICSLLKEFGEERSPKSLALTASLRAFSREKRLSFDAAQAVINRLFKCEVPHQCPRGKAIIIKISQEDLAKRFTHAT